MVAAWFAYLQASPGLVVVHRRDELGLSYSVAGLHVAAFAAGSTAALWATLPGAPGGPAARISARSASWRSVKGGTGFGVRTLVELLTTFTKPKRSEA